MAIFLNNTPIYNEINNSYTIDIANKKELTF